jgi:hypothetical protein
VHRATQDVSIWWDPYCSGIEADKRFDNTILVRPGSACTIRVTIANDSRLGAHVSYLVANLPETYPAELRPADGTSELPDSESESSGNVDGIFGVDLDVPPHDTRTIDIEVRWTRELCAEESDLLSVEGWPSATVEIWGDSFTVAADQYFAVSRDATACRS